MDHAENTVEHFIQRLIVSRSVAESWELVCEIFKSYGFDRILYGKKIDVSVENFYSHHDTMVLSTYGAEIDRLFLDSRHHLTSPTALWALENYGAISWGTTAERIADGTLPDDQVKTHLVLRDLGLDAGLTYSVPSHTPAFRSAFGLAYLQGHGQKAADDAWRKYSHILIQIMCIFDISVLQFPNIPTGNKLDEKTLDFMRLLAEGRSMREVAELRNCHFRTVDSRLAKARELLGAANTLQAIVMAKDQGQL